MLFVGGKEVIFSTSFVAADNEEVLFDYDLLGNTQKVSITFTNEQGDNGGRWDIGDDNIMRWTINKWASSLLTTSSGPAKFGDIDGRKIYIHFAHFSGGADLAMHFCHVYILLGPKHGE